MARAFSEAGKPASYVTVPVIYRETLSPVAGYLPGNGVHGRRSFIGKPLSTVAGYYRKRGECRYLGSGLPLVSTPNGSSRIPIRKAIEVTATGRPSVW